MNHDPADEHPAPAQPTAAHSEAEPRPESEADHREAEHRPEVEGESGGTRRAVQMASGWVLVSAAVGIVIGFVWVALAPRVTLTVAADGVTQDRGAASVPFDADLLLGGMLLTAGLALSVAWLARGARSPTASTIGLVLGGLLAGGIAMTLAGALTGMGTAIADLPPGTVADAPLRLRSWPMLLWWPAAVLVIAAVSSLKSEPAPDQLPEATPTP